MSFLLIPLFITYFNLRVAQHDSASCVWMPVRGSTKYLEWFTTLCVATLFSRWSRYLYAPQSSVCTSVPGRIHFLIIGCRVAASLPLTTWKYPRQGVYSVVTMSKIQTSRSALLPRLFWDKNNSPCKQVFNTLPLLSLGNLIILLHPTITFSNTDSQAANWTKLKKKKNRVPWVRFFAGSNN